MRYCTVLLVGVMWFGHGQTLVDLRTQTKSVDFTSANTTKPFKSGTVLPPACSVGEAFFKTDAPAGSNLYACTSPNLWSLEGSAPTLAGDVTGPAGANVVTQISGRPISPAAPVNGQALVWSAAANRWEAQTVSGPAGQGYTWRGAWSGATAYSAYETVSYSGSSYVAVASSTGVTPGTDGTKWALLAQQGSGTGTVNGGIAGQLGYYASSATALSGTANANISNGTLTLGSANTVLGALILEGNASGAATIQPQSAGGTFNFNLPANAGSSGQPLLSGGGGSAPMTFGTLGVGAGGTGITSGTSGGVLGFTGSGALTSSAALTQNALVLGGGAGATPTVLGSLGTTTSVLHGNTAGAPTFGPVSLAGDVTGTLPASNGGTGSASFTVNAPLLGNGSNPIAVGARSGNTTTFATTSGGLTSGNCAKFDTNGNIVDNGAACGAGGSGALVKVNGGAAIGPQPTLNFIPGTGLAGYTGVVNGSQIDITQGVDTAYLNTNYPRLGASNTYAGGGLQDMNAMDFRLPVHSNDPATCVTGQIEFNSTGTVGKICTAANVWTSLAAGGGTLGDPGGSGIVVRTSLNTTANRSMGAGTGITVTNGDGTAGNPTMAVNTAVISTHDQIHANDNYMTLTSSGVTAYTGTMANKALTAYATGMVITFIPDVACNGSDTINIDSLGIKNIKQSDGTTACTASQMAASRPVDLYYDGTVFRLPDHSGVGTCDVSHFITGTGTCATPAGAGTVTTTGSPANGQLAKFSSASSVTTATAQDIAGITFAAGGGTAQAQTAAYSPALTALVAGTQVCWLPTAANTGGGPTFAPNGLTAHTIVKAGSAALAANDLTTTAIACAIYDATGTQWELLNPQTTIAGSGSGYSTIDTTGPGGVLPAPTGQTQRTTFNANWPLVASDNGSLTNLEVRGPIDPRKYAYEFQEFISTGNSGNNIVGAPGWNVYANGAGSAASSVASVAGTYGVEECITGATSGNSCDLAELTNGLAVWGNSTFDIQFRMAMSRTTNISVFGGVNGANPGEGGGVSYIGIAYDTNQGTPDTNLMCVANKQGASVTRTSMGIAPDSNYHTYRVRSTTAGTILCSIDGGTETSVTGANVPNASFISPDLSVITRAASTAYIHVDFWSSVLAITR